MIAGAPCRLVHLKDNMADKVDKAKADGIKQVTEAGVKIKEMDYMPWAKVRLKGDAGNVADHITPQHVPKELNKAKATRRARAKASRTRATRRGRATTRVARLQAKDPKEAAGSAVEHITPADAPRAPAEASLLMP